MQSGKIKHWNHDKGYGFIDANNQSEDVFFHVSKVTLAQPISIGQCVYFTSERNKSNQLRATKVTSVSENSDIFRSSDANLASLAPKSPYQNNRKRTPKNSKSERNKRRPLSTLLSLIAIIAVVVYFLSDFKDSFFEDKLTPTPISQTLSEQLEPSAFSAITGDPQVDNTIALIQQDGPFPYPHKDGSTFYNREGRLPIQSQGYYHEYTVPTLGISDRGARRIVTGGNPPTIYYLTVDHYDSFRKLDVH